MTLIPFSVLLPILAVSLFAAWGVQSAVDRRRRLPRGLLQAELAAAAIVVIKFTSLLRERGPVAFWTGIGAAVVLLVNDLICFFRGLRTSPR